MPGRPEQIGRGGEDQWSYDFPAWLPYMGGVSLKMVARFPNKPWVFPTKNDHFGV